jgi:hypothetical protein
VDADHGIARAGFLVLQRDAVDQCAFHGCPR